MLSRSIGIGSTKRKKKKRKMDLEDRRRETGDKRGMAEDRHNVHAPSPAVYPYIVERCPKERPFAVRGPMQESSNLLLDSKQ